MISASDRQNIMSLIDEALANGGDRVTACSVLGVNQSTYFRWKNQVQKHGTTCDLRPSAQHAVPHNKLSLEERTQVLDTLHSKEFADASPRQVVPALADRGLYVCSESTMYRILKEHDENHHRGRSKPPVQRNPPSHVAYAPNKVWSWDITYLNGPVKGVYFFLYMVMDIFSRCIVGWEVWEEQTGEHASTLISKACHAQRIPLGSALILHSDNGSPMKSCTLLAKLEDLGVMPSFSRPHVSNDNPFSESLFKTCKYRPNFLVEGFASLQEAREWCAAEVSYYNFSHYHSGIKYLTPHVRHQGLEQNVVRARTSVYEDAKAKHPERWNGRAIRDWVPPDKVSLNPINE